MDFGREKYSAAAGASVQHGSTEVKEAHFRKIIDELVDSISNIKLWVLKNSYANRYETTKSLIYRMHHCIIVSLSVV